METINWSSDNVNKETPWWIKIIYQTLGFVSSLWILAVEPRCPNIPLLFTHRLDIGLFIATVAVYQFCQYFGFKQPIDFSKEISTSKEQLPANTETNASTPNNPA